MNKEEQEINYVPSRYSKLLNLYTRNYMKWVSPFLNCISKSCQYGAKYPIFKVLKAISKIFLLNEIEIIFLAYMIRETAWDIKDKLITYNSESIRDVVCYSNDQPEYKSLILYLMVTSYSVKFYLNETTTEVLEEANKICPNFKVIFQNWAKKHAALTKRINPKTLNKVYQALVQQTRREEPDFNMIVDAIIQISPAYNPEKNDTKKKQAEIKRQPVKKIKSEHPIIISSTQQGKPTVSNVQSSQSHGHQNQAPTFSSSALYDIAAHAKTHNAQILNSMNLFRSRNVPLNKSGSFLGSSFLGMPRYDARDEELCESFLLNLKEGQSEQNIIIQENQEQGQTDINNPQTSIINLQRGISATEKFWAEPQEKKEEGEK